MKKRILGHEARTQRWGYAFVAPFIIVFCLFSFWPIVNTFKLSFQNDRTNVREVKFVGFENYSRLLAREEVQVPAYDKDGVQVGSRTTKKWVSSFIPSLKNTFIIWGLNFIPQLGLALLLAIWLSDAQLNLRSKGLFRAIIYMPNLLTAASVAFLFRSLFGYDQGNLNAPVHQFLRYFNIQPTDLFRSEMFTRSLVAFIQWWMWYGHTLILLMAGITSIPVSLFESALVDGANSRQTTWHITLPLLRPIMLFILVTSMIGGMQMFDIPFLLTNRIGAPGNSIRTTIMYQYNMSFMGNNDLSYGAAVSVGVFIVTIFLALLIFFFMQDRSELKKKRGGIK